MNLVELRNEFDEKGYIILKDFFDKEELMRCEKAIAQLYAQQAYKIAPYRKKMTKHFSEYSTYKDICQIYNMMEEIDKEALYQVHKMILENYFIRKFVNNETLVDLAGALIDVEKDIALINGMGLFVNKPGTNRLLYKWHTAEHGYPKRRKCLSVWFPLYIPKNEQNGVMYVAEGSHKIQFPFVEYTGYSTSDKGKSNQLTQREIPEYLIDHYKKVPTLAKPGDVVLFHHSLVHTSSVNKSNDISFAGVIKVWEVSKDFTLSGNIAATPYSGTDSGRAELIIE
jgi:ectoine hydroxylase-related dioxygenase (phytanoyl-CoA dioxygenase family)